jgi:hypothetical protein
MVKVRTGAFHSQKNQRKANEMERTARLKKSPTSTSVVVTGRFPTYNRRACLVVDKSGEAPAIPGPPTAPITPGITVRAAYPVECAAKSMPDRADDGASDNGGATTVYTGIGSPGCCWCGCACACAALRGIDGREDGACASALAGGGKGIPYAGSVTSHIVRRLRGVRTSSAARVVAGSSKTGFDAGVGGVAGADAVCVGGVPGIGAA